MPRIRRLPPDVVNRIAAGEVIERPASVVKELVENSIDAEATEVLVDLEEGGCKRLTVQDNGCGMDADDLVLAFESHATSKLEDNAFEGSLFGISTLGFRGEALPSIGSVADVEVVSRRPRSEHAHKLRPGRSGDPEPAAGEPGTVIEVRDLFHNVPARRKFLRAPSTELSWVLKQINRIALPHPGVRFLVTSSGKRLLDLPACGSLRERLVQTIDRKHVDDLLEFREPATERTPEVHGFVGSPRWRRGDTRLQHFFVNGRWVTDRSLTAALRAAYQGFLIPGNHPVGWIFLDFAPDAVDVNVHPTKSEVRFRDAGRIFPLIRDAIRRVLAPAAAIDASHEGADEAPDEAAPSRGDPPVTSTASRSQDPVPRQASLPLFDELEIRGRHLPRPSLSAGGSSPPRRSCGDRPSSSGGSSRRPGPSGPPPPVSRLFGADSEAGLPSSDVAPEPSERGRIDPGRASADRGAVPRAFQFLDSYIVVEEAGGIRLVDQHALHEKILFEEIHRRLLEGDILQQRLIVPEIVTLSPEQAPLIDRGRDILARCGYEIESFGEHDVAVHAVPEMLERRAGTGRGAGKSNTPDIVLAVFQWLAEDESAVELPPIDSDADAAVPDVVLARYRDLASLMACKRAVKAGASLSQQEIDALLAQGDLADDPRNCPHGRPTTVRLSHRELERLFDRK